MLYIIVCRALAIQMWTNFLVYCEDIEPFTADFSKCYQNVSEYFFYNENKKGHF